MKKLLLLIILAGGMIQAQTYLMPFRDAYKLRVSKGYDSTATTIVLSSGQGAYLPDEAFELVWYNSSKYFHPFDDADAEWIRVGTRSGDTLKSVLRGQNRTTRKNHNLAGYTYRVMPVISENMWLKVDTILTNAGAYQAMNRLELAESLNTGSNTMTSVWSFGDTAKFNSAIYSAVGTNSIIYLNGSNIITALGIPTSAKILGGGSSSIPNFYYLVGAGGASVTVSNDTIYIVAGGGGVGSDSITSIQSPANTITVTNPSGPTVSIDVKVGGLDSTRYGTESITNSALGDSIITSEKFHANAVAPSAIYATTAGGAPPTGSIASGDAAGSSYPNFVIKGDAITSSKILNNTIITADLASNCKSPLAGYADSVFNQSTLLAAKLDLTRRAKFSLSGQSFFYDSLRIIQGTYMEIIQSGNTLTFNSTAGGTDDSVLYSDYTGIALDVDESKKVYATPATSEIAIWDETQTIKGSGVSTSKLDSIVNPSEISDHLDVQSGVAGTYTNMSAVVNSNGIITSASSSTEGGISFYGVDEFTTTANYDTVLDAQINEGDIFLVTPYGSAAWQPYGDDAIGYWCETGKLISCRNKAAGTVTSGMKYVYARIATGSAFNPQNLTSATLQFWAEDRLESGYSDSTRLSTMKDNSPYSYHATNSASKGCFYTTGNYYRFLGNVDTNYMNSNSLATLLKGSSQSYTIFAVIRYNQIYTPSRMNPIFSFSSSTSSTWLAYYGIRSGSNNKFYLRADIQGYDLDSANSNYDSPNIVLDATDSLNALTEFNIVEFRFDGDTLHLHFNDMTPKYSGFIESDSLNVNLFTIGAFYSQSSALYAVPSDMRQGGLFIFSGELSDVDRSYMYTKLDAIYNTPYTTP